MCICAPAASRSKLAISALNNQKLGSTPLWFSSWTVECEASLFLRYNCLTQIHIYTELEIDIDFPNFCHPWIGFTRLYEHPGDLLVVYRCQQGYTKAYGNKMHDTKNFSVGKIKFFIFFKVARTYKQIVLKLRTIQKLNLTNLQSWNVV